MSQKVEVSAVKAVPGKKPVGALEIGVPDLVGMNLPSLGDSTGANPIRVNLRETCYYGELAAVAHGIIRNTKDELPGLETVIKLLENRDSGSRDLAAYLLTEIGSHIYQSGPKKGAVQAALFG